MSKHVTSLVYSRKAGSLLRKSVLAYMADVANHDGTGIWSSKQRIADEIEASRRGVLDAIKSLIADGVLIENGKRRCKNGYTIEYSINLDVVAKLPEMPHNVDHPGKSARVQDVPPTPELGASDPGTGCHQTVHNQIEPDTSNEVSKAQAPKKSKKRGSQIGSWTPGPMDFAFARKKGLTQQEVNHALEAFPAHHKSKGTISKDWSASWRTWCLNTIKFRKPADNRTAGARDSFSAFDKFGSPMDGPQAPDLWQDGSTIEGEFAYASEDDAPRLFIAGSNRG